MQVNKTYLRYGDAFDLFETDVKESTYICPETKTTLI